MLSDCPAWPAELADYYRQTGCWEGITFGELLRDRAERFGERTAVVSGDERLTYKELDQRADRLAYGFAALGIRSKDRVVVQLPNRSAFIEVVFGLFRLGAKPIMALPSHRSSEIKYFSQFAEAAAYVIPDKFGGFDYRKLAAEVQQEVPQLRQVIVAGVPEGGQVGLDEVYAKGAAAEQAAKPGAGAGALVIAGKRSDAAAGETAAALSDMSVEVTEAAEASSPGQALPLVRSSDVALFQLSGGSTGLPKLIPRTHDDYIYSLKASVDVCGLDETSVYLAALPVAHNFPLSSPGALGTLYAGGTVVLSPGPSADEAFPLIERERVTITALVPPLALMWLEAVATRTADLSSLQVLQVGGAKFSAEAARRVKPVLGCQLQQVFGMAEGLVNYTRLDDPEEIVIHTQGRPMSAYDELRIVDEDDREVEPGETGQLLTRGPYTIRGYYKAEEHNAKAFTSDGFYRTGDVVRLTPQGYIIVEGRVKDQINRGGEKVAAEEIENHLLAHPAIHDAAVVSMPDDFLGERTCAFVIAREPKPSAAELRAFLRGRGVAAYKIPDRVEYAEAFPKTAFGKVSKKDLRRKITELLTLERK
ncbi:(2,3-dihydroxybenzoyl)adenylate synthase [Paenibacillus turpanensis]|uniref:(2,3-dihydroxybenzoyl)adenylate synthase n=1 Tax=Paenibacillus turpanensis TaxID=2689078 RepID=UPI0014092DA5|nr:AMP-binding protein [Paenibacillus turpanensis]